jgi:hypothetical protein
MGNLQKITRQAAMSGILDEIERTPDMKRIFDPEKHAINPDLTHLNYSLVEHTEKATDYLQKRLSEVKVQNRADVKVLGQWVWTLPKDLDPKYQKQFFQEIYNFNVEKFGAENICYATVHLDETNPHLHLGIIPVVKIDGHRTDGFTEKVRAKDVFDRNYLQHAHSELEQYLNDKLGTEVHIINGQTLGVDGIKNYKAAKDLAKTVAALNTEIVEKKEEIRKLDTIIDGKKDELASINKEIEVQTGVLNKLKLAAEKVKGLIKNVVESIKGAPNMLDMFYYWLNRNASKEEMEDSVTSFNEALQTNGEAIAQAVKDGENPFSEPEIEV